MAFWGWGCHILVSLPIYARVCSVSHIDGIVIIRLQKMQDSIPVVGMVPAIGSGPVLYMYIETTIQRIQIANDFIDLLK